jgi:hypothetical protein
MLHQEVRVFGNASYQEFVSQLGNTPVVYHRTGRPDELTWNGWQRKFDTGNILGTVSQSGGVPTGALSEVDSNSNGMYIKRFDGTLTNIRKVTIDLSQLKNDFSVAFPFVSPGGEFTEISSFISFPGMISVQRDAAITTYVRGTTTQFLVATHTVAASTQLVDVVLRSEGRWKAF